MKVPNFDEFKDRLLAIWDNLIQKSDEDEMADMGRERIVVFVVALILAFCLWLMVNLSLVYNLNIDLPISLGAVPQDQALTEDLPEQATVSISGEGWKLINLYNNPPSINIDVNENEVNIYEQVQEQMNTRPDVSVQKVQPLVLNVDLEERVSKKVPVKSNIDVSFSQQYDFTMPPRLEPDSITIAGARTLIEKINEWPTDSVEFSNLSQDLSQEVPLKEPGSLIELSQEEVEFNAEVSQFTEGEVEIGVETRNLPPAQNISYSPSSVTVKYDVPIDQYNDVQEITPFEVFITYSQIEQDSTGFVTPQVVPTTDEFHLKLKSVQPRRVAYFIVLDN